MILDQPAAEDEQAAEGAGPSSAGPAAPWTEEPWTEEEYQQEVAGLVADEAPAVFALVEDRDDRSDGRIAAWVLEFHHRVDVIASDGGLWMRVTSADRVLARFGHQPGVTARLVPAGRS